MLSQNIQAQDQKPPKTCNCSEPDTCPLKGQCLVKEVMYQATITTAESTETIIYKLLKSLLNKNLKFQDH